MLAILGITDEQTHCDECGRVELKSTVVLGDEGAEVGRYGSTCAGRVLTRANGRKYSGVLDMARTAEFVRREGVRDDFRRAIKSAEAGKHLDAMYWRNQAVERGLIRPDEIDLNERLLTWARGFRRGEVGVWGS